MRDYRFGFNLHGATSLAGLRETCHAAEEFGYDVVLVPDHLGRDCPSPFPTLVAAAGATQRMRVGTYVLNIGFWNPSILARDAAATDTLTEGRLELGLGLGYVKSEFDAAGLPWQRFSERAGRLEQAVDTLDRLLGTADPRGYAAVQRPRPPIMLAGQSDRMLALAAARADIVGHTGARQAKGAPAGSLAVGTADDLDERVAFFRAQAGSRAGQIETNLLIQSVVVTGDRLAAARKAAGDYGLDLSPREVLDIPILLIGTVAEIAAQVEERRERYGVTYFTVHEPSMRAFGPVIAAIRG
jgi:probable F420-dependent oxidoreductase